MQGDTNTTDVAATTDTAVPTAAALIDEVKTAAKEVRDGALDQVQELKADMSERAAGTANEKKSALADSLGSVVNALRAAEKALRDDGQDSLATYSSSLASYVDRSSGYIRDNDMNGLMADLQKAGRENSGMFMGGTFVAGAALGRFLRASAPEPAMGDAPRTSGESSTPNMPASNTSNTSTDGAMR